MGSCLAIATQCLSMKLNLSNVFILFVFVGLAYNGNGYCIVFVPGSSIAMPDFFPYSSIYNVRSFAFIMPMDTFP